MNISDIKIKKEFKILLIIGVVYIALILLFISKFNFNLSSTIELSKNHIMEYTGKIPPGTILHKNNGFDGQYYYMIALNPSLEKIHTSPNFLQRVFYPMLAKVLALNITSLLPLSFIVINLASILISSYVLMLLLKKYNANINLVYLWALNVGFLISITRNLTEPLMVCFIVLMIYFIEKGNHYLAATSLALAILTRELALTIYAAVLLYFLIKIDFKKFALYFISIIPFSIWEYYIYLKTGYLALFVSAGAVSFLPKGILGYFIGVLPNINYYIVKPVVAPEEHIASSNYFFTYLQDINKIFSPLPILIFTIILAAILIINFLKERKFTLYTILLLSQVTLIAILQGDLFFKEVDTVGRYSLPMFFLSILYFGERGKKYNRILAVLLILSSVLYFIQRFILPKGGFLIIT